MADLEKIKSGIQKARIEIEQQLGPQMVILAADAAALIENRIVSKGQNKDGRNLSPYSSQTVPAYFYAGRSRNAAGENQVQKAIKQRQGVSYRQFRQFNGLNVNVKNLQFTGQMWQEFGVRKVQRLGRGIYEIEIGGKTAYSETLLGYHSKRENTPISAPSQQEINIVTKSVSERLTSILKNALR